MRTYPTVALVRALSHRAPRSLSAALLAVSFITLTPLVSAQSAPAIQSAALNPGSIDGTLNFEGRNAADVIVTVKETGKQAVTNRRGSYRIADVAPGTYTLEATAEGYQKLYITDVVVKPGSRLTLSQVEMRRLSNGVTELERYIVKAESSDVTELDPFEVSGRKEKPFTVNMDIPRTINDAQPYYIFDSKTIDQSGAVNVEDFLKKRLTMNSVAQSHSQLAGGNGNAVTGPSVFGNASSINLRGLGTDKTLILVNGRRAPDIAFQSTLSQPDLNGIPLSAIDRIEVLPASASGIYGGSALGGVVNVILKKSYQGGEVRLTYENTWDTDAPIRTASISYGQKIEATKTQILINAQWSDSESLLLQDRRSLYERGLSIALKNSQSYVYGFYTIGSLPNIRSLNGAPLVLKDGTVLSSSFTHIPAGTSATTPSATLKAGLIANAGTFDLAPPPTWQNPTGLYRQLTSTPTTKAFRASVRQELWPTVEANLDWSHRENVSFARHNSLIPLYFLGANVPTNPFSNFVAVTIPEEESVIGGSKSINDSLSVGLVVDLPWNWNGQFDYSWSRQKLAYQRPQYIAQTSDINSGALNIFVDTLQNPPDWKKYLNPGSVLNMESLLSDFAARASGPVAVLPWGALNMTFGLEHRVAKTPENIAEGPIGSTRTRTLFYDRRQVTDSGYAETLIPLVKQDWIPFVHSLELQLSGRSERYEVDTGTPSYETNLSTGVVTYGSPNLNGQPIFARTSYASNNATMGIKYQPKREIIFRASVATAFLPPTPSQLTKNPLPAAFTTTVLDPKNNNLPVTVQFISGGNPDLQPQNSRSWNAGVIWIPEFKALKGLRVNLEYNKIRQFDFITSLNPQIFVDNEDLFDRVTRDSSGRITLVDLSLVNLFKLETESWDLSVNYGFKTGFGTFSIDAVQSLLTHAKAQYSLTLPEYDAAGFPSEGGSAKYKSNGTLRWEWRNWLVGWSSTYFGSYKQNGAKGGPAAQRSATPVTTYTLPQGADSIPSQLYHDVVIGYSFRDRIQSHAAMGDRMLSNLSIQVGVKNVFNHEPPYDAYYALFISPYGDTRLRSYWVSLKKAF